MVRIRLRTWSKTKIELITIILLNSIKISLEKKKSKLKRTRRRNLRILNCGRGPNARKKRMPLRKKPKKMEVKKPKTSIMQLKNITIRG